MGKIVMAYVAIFCLLILVSANSITTSLKQSKIANSGMCEEEIEDIPVPAPVEEDTNEDDGPTKLIFHSMVFHSFAATRKAVATNYFLTSFHFLEIISPPPQA